MCNIIPFSWVANNRKPLSTDWKAHLASLRRSSLIINVKLKGSLNISSRLLGHFKLIFCVQIVSYCESFRGLRPLSPHRGSAPGLRQGP